ncbi:osteoclast-stimulating factor 1-like [Ischnura elegans]|uniref:osteoclast-stimulating factor 1-like n=1 Tax=Ischnura elegans TaxID=197161 RepID=UPI001ED8972F|nr:osteoclast-stimulating factor 1-like [Ischnura elegans]
MSSATGVAYPTPPKVAPKPGTVKVVRALYSYTAQQPDELTFQEGDVMYVYDQVTDANWWKARCDDKTGLIPSNYVENHVQEIELPMHEAARRGNLSFIRECLQQGVSATALDAAHNTALQWACHAGHIDCVKELLPVSCKGINHQNKVGDTPLHSAASRGHADVVKLLLDSSVAADPTIVNCMGETPLDLARDPVSIGILKEALYLRKGKRLSSQASYDPNEYVGDDDSE